MQTLLLLALQITLLGMGLVFLAIVLLWGMMALLVTLTRAREEAAPAAPAAVENAPSAGEVNELGRLRARAAAAAVAIALAEQSLSTAHPLADPPTAIVSAWQLGMRSRQMYDKGHR